MITLQAFIDVFSPPNFVVDFNCKTCICIHHSFVALDSKLFLQPFLSLIFAFDYFIGNSIRACQALGRLILALEVDSKIFNEVLKPLLDAKLSENIVRHVFNLDDDSPIEKRAKINLDCE